MPRIQNQQTLEYIDLFDDDNDVPEHSTVQISPKPKAAGFSDSDATIASPPNDILMTPRFTTTNHTAIKRSDTSSTSSIIDDKRIHVVVGGSIISLLPLNHICQEEWVTEDGNSTSSGLITKRIRVVAGGATISSLSFDQCLQEKSDSIEAKGNLQAVITDNNDRNVICVKMMLQHQVLLNLFKRK
jgi:hypothetical protein